MKNNLEQIERHLRSIAKRYKSVKYSLSLVIVFLMVGINVFSEELMTQEAVSRESIQNSVGNLQTKINDLKSQNDKQLEGLRLELIQLMEQGNQVIKSPWSSWQFGINYMYSKWNGAYKGRGDKKNWPKDLREYFTDPLKRFVKNDSVTSSTYGLTTLNILYEPPAEITVSAGIRPKNVNKKESKFEPKEPAGALPTFEPRLIGTPGKPVAPATPSVNVFDTPDIPANGQSFAQRPIIGKRTADEYDNQISPRFNNAVVAQNYDEYTPEPDTPNGNIDVNMGETTTWGGGKIRLKSTVPEGRPFENGATETKDVNGAPRTMPKDPFISKPSGTYYLNPGKVETRDVWDIEGKKKDTVNAFISDSRDHDTTINGNYTVKNLGSGPTTKLFFSYNPSGVGGKKYDNKASWGWSDGTEQAVNRVAKFTGNLTLKGVEDPNNKTALVGLEHQLWAKSKTSTHKDDKDEWNNSNSNSTLLNTGNITLASGNYLVGMMIDVEYSNDKNHKNHKTINKGTININSKNSVGIDFAKYELGLLQTDVSLGNINVNGSNNYGFRMAKLFDGETKTYQGADNGSNLTVDGNKYYDNTTITGEGGKIVVGGKENVGVSISKGVSADKSANPISNIKSLNIEVVGENVVGFLRNKDFSINNTGNIVLDDTTVQSLTFGNGAKNSTLVRSDNGTIDIKKNLNATKGSTGNSFSQATSGGRVVNHSILKSTLSHFTGMISYGRGNLRSSTAINKGTIELTGDSDSNIGMAALNSGEIRNENGTIKVLGKGKNKAAIYTDQTSSATLNGGNYFISGESSSGIYNQGSTILGDNNKIFASNGAVGIYSSGGTIDGSHAANGVDIEVDDGDSEEKGLAVYGENGTDIKLQNSKINVKKGIAGVAAFGANTKINLNGATLKYSGSGYAAYATGGGKIDLSNSRIELRGRATGFEMAGSGTSPITLNSNTRIHVYSNDVTVMNIKDMASLNYSNLNSTAFNSYLQGATVHAENGATDYKLAAVDGIGAYNINSSLDKKLAVNPANKNTNDYIFTRLLSVQRARMNLKSGNNVRAVLSSSELAAIKEKTVVGLAMNSSKNAVSNTETAINLENNTTVTADRTDAGDGAVGLFVNYGTVNVASGATINVEKENNVVNEKAVGIYAVNGTEVDNKGTINVGGKNSIGIFGIAYRTDNAGNKKIDEFGSNAVGQGKVNIKNQGTLSLNGEGASGILVKNNKGTAASLGEHKALNTGTINMSGNKAIGMFAEKGYLKNEGTINITGSQQGIGMYGHLGSILENGTNGKINVADSNDENKLNIGMFTDDINTKIMNAGKISVGKNSYGIYGKNITTTATSKIKTGDNGVGIFSSTKDSNTTLDLAPGSEITVGNNNAVGVFSLGNKAAHITSFSKMNIGNGSFGYVIRSKGSTLNSNYAGETELKQDGTYIYSTDEDGTITNKTKLKSSGNKNYGIYASGNVKNLADINFATGYGNVGLYSTSNNSNKGITNGEAGSSGIKPKITVGASKIRDTNGNLLKEKDRLYSIGMAAGYSWTEEDLKKPEAQRPKQFIGRIVNYGTISVTGDDGIGMYAVGRGSRAINHGLIDLSGKNSIGMYLDQGAIGENYGTIRTAPNNTKDGIIGVVALNGSVIKNYGTISISGAGNTGIYKAQGGNNEGKKPEVSNGATDISSKATADTSKKLGTSQILSPPGATNAVIKEKGKVLTPDYVDRPTPNAPNVRAGSTILNLKQLQKFNGNSRARASELGMYIDTSGIKFTKPIEGLEKLTNLKRINLIFGVEATKYSNNTAIQIGSNILEPYNKVIEKLSRSGSGKKWILNSSSLTWMATATQNPSNGTLGNVYMKKIPYTTFAVKGDTDTYNFLDGLEQRYGVEGLNSREKELFNKLNDIGKGEAQLFVQAVDEMKGHQYANTQQRVYATGQILDTEFNYLREEWATASKDSNKIKAFGARGEYKTNTAGVIDYKNYAYGVAYIHENESVKLGKDIGWYTGFVHNTFRFEDIGKSKEEMLLGKIGMFKSIPFDDDNSLNWTVSGNVFVGRNKMHRKFLIVDEIFNAKSKYYAYGIGVKNEIGKEFRLSEDFSIRPYGALKLEYGRISKIKEKTGEIRLEVKSNDYVSIKPEIGTELKYKYLFTNRKTLTVGLGVAYENELGKVANPKNKARVAYTAADWYNLRGEKEDRRGNIKTDLTIGLENTRFGATANVGYDTKGHNVRTGLGLRVIF
ncbi:autotransporter domain-containing protein [Fusobacterium nucleatum subsp. nucleatum ATCC 25586]|uniref:Autotransporter domain-containing protein n=2 Tax=Fusobacterium nucleatum subsp. nucleatum (strain ATCC 25586 / DSM 15643 / BCRC 10681 / CIP 101130 / JCM 8532 / KCTC 2640 / LMG 13131 / VPI 4355) TaxID=190304 RepID=A0ABN5J3P3_FUSNN|nr:autotransporter-associated N-terminal domain-containing protein [Fusobacterium nucleatum]AVQ14852.1 autotransporter domain-containing protein [Fusobacterium nucleatum subsp. nucleatum ATCC 25586]WMS29699.1 autotransporter-associated N-terminal domain-containing protein [Fusobacterium nucleatum]